MNLDHDAERTKEGKMAKKVLVLSPSTQEANVGVANYGNEQENMRRVAAEVKYLLNNLTKEIEVHVVIKESLKEIVLLSNNIYKEEDDFIHLALHSNALKGIEQTAAYGCEAYYHYKTPVGSKSILLANRLVYNLGIIVGKRKASPDNVLYQGGLYELRETKGLATLVELFFHDNPNDVENYKREFSAIVRAIVRSILEVFGIPYPPEQPSQVEPTHPKSDEILDYVSNYNESWKRFLRRIAQDVEYPEGKNIPTLLERIWEHKKAE